MSTVTTAFLPLSAFRVYFRKNYKETHPIWNTNSLQCAHLSRTPAELPTSQVSPTEHVGLVYALSEHHDCGIISHQSTHRTPAWEIDRICGDSTIMAGLLDELHSLDREDPFVRHECQSV